MYSIDYIEAVVYEAIEQVTGMTNIDSNVCLLDKNVGIMPAEFLYIFEHVESKLGMPINSVLTENTYEVFFVDKLVEAIYKIYISSNMEICDEQSTD